MGIDWDSTWMLNSADTFGSHQSSSLSLTLQKYWLKFDFRLSLIMHTAPAAPPSCQTKGPRSKTNTRKCAIILMGSLFSSTQASVHVISQQSHFWTTVWQGSSIETEACKLFFPFLYINIYIYSCLSTLGQHFSVNWHQDSGSPEVT